MVVGVYVSVYAWSKKNNDGYCRVTYENIFWSLFMYFSFFLLFSNFFINRYIKPNNINTKKIQLQNSKKSI